MAWLEEHQAKEAARLIQVSTVRSAVVSLIESNGRITSVAEVHRQAKLQGADDLKLKRVHQIMARNLGLKFKRLKTINVRANCKQALIQRQQFALTLISLMLEGKRVINVDESAVGQGVYYRSSWGVTGEPIAQNVKPFGQRLSLLAAIDTDGLTYFALSQSATDARVFGTFLLRLV